MQCPKTRWSCCELCQRRIRAEGLADEYSLQSWFIGRIHDFLARCGKRLIGWDEILEGGLHPGTIVMSWRVRKLFHMPVTTGTGLLECHELWRE